MGRSQAHLRRVQGMDSTARGTGGGGKGRTGKTRDPGILTKPTVAGTRTNGQILTGTNGTFRNGGAVTRVWGRADSATGQINLIAGQTAATYTQQAADVGKFVFFGNQSSNRYGTTTSWSAAGAATA